MQSENTAIVPDRLIRRDEVLLRTGLRRTRFQEMVKKGQFPQPLPNITRARLWSERAVVGWIHAIVNGSSEAA